MATDCREAGERVKRFFPLAAAVASRRDLSLPAKLVHACLSSYTRLPEARPSQDRIAREIGICRKSVSRAVRELTALGLVAVDVGYSGKASKYLLTDGERESRDSQSHGDSQSHHSGTPMPKILGLSVPPLEGKESPLEASASDAVADGINQTPEERRAWLALALAAFNPNLPEPDARLIDRLLTGAGAASDDAIEAALQTMFAAGVPDRMRSWGLLLTALPEELRKASA